MSVSAPRVPDLLRGLLDDAAVFPPGSVPPAEAVPAHRRHLRGPAAALVGPLVLAMSHLEEPGETFAAPPGEPDLDLAVTAPLDRARAAAEAASGVPGVRLAVLEVALGETTDPGAVVPALTEALAGHPGVTAAVELPRDERRDAVLEALVGTPYLAKLRTGGVRADLHPSEAELAATVLAAVRAGVPFKATAGLHHAVRRTDPATGFEQHGFLNLLLATGAAVAGAGPDGPDGLVAVLADRDAARVAERVHGLDPRVRRAFRSFGTCSIEEPVGDLVDLGLLDRAVVEVPA
jgi:hypothetical protein